MKLLASLIVLVCLVAGCSSPTEPSANVPFSVVDLRVGTGATAAVGSPVSVNYTLWLYNAGGVDNKGSRLETGPFSFTVGQGVITGFSQGVTGMRVGGLRRVTIPPNLAYGSQGGQTIPPNATLIFEIDLVSIP